MVQWGSPLPRQTRGSSGAAAERGSLLLRRGHGGGGAAVGRDGSASSWAAPSADSAAAVKH